MTYFRSLLNQLRVMLYCLVQLNTKNCKINSMSCVAETSLTYAYGSRGVGGF